VAAAIGSACTSGSTETSHVLAAMGFPEDEARGSLRLSLGRTTTEADIDAAAEIVPRVLSRMRASSTVAPAGVGEPLEAVVR
jgi:cysteine desulfurase